VTADFDVCGVRLVSGRVPIAGRGPELQDGLLAYGALVSVSRRFWAQRRERPLPGLVSDLLAVRRAGSGRAKEGQYCEHTAVVLG
jgi:hypothetical protein